MHPNRIAVYLTVLAGIAGAVAPAVADLDTTSTASVIAGLGAIVAVVVKWLAGWQEHEYRQADVNDDTGLPADPLHPDLVAVEPTDPAGLPEDVGNTDGGVA